MASDSLQELQRLSGIKQPDSDNISSWVIEWFKSHFVHHNMIVSDLVRPALLFVRKFKPILNASFAHELTPYLLHSLPQPTPQNSTQKAADLFKWIFWATHNNASFTFTACLPQEEICYLSKLKDNLKLDDEEKKDLQLFLDSFAPKLLDFELSETILFLASKTEGRNLFSRLRTFPEPLRKVYLVNLRKFWGIGIRAASKRQTMHKAIFSLSDKQQEDLILNLASHFEKMKHPHKYQHLKTMALMPDTLPSQAFPALKTVFEYLNPDDYGSYKINDWLKNFENIPSSLRSCILLTCAPYLIKDMNEESIPELFKVAAALPQDRISSAMPHLIPFMQCLCYSQYENLKSRMSKIDPRLEFLEYLEPILYLFGSNKGYTSTFSDFFYHIQHLPAARIQSLISSLLPFKAQFKSDEHFTALARILALLYPQDYQELIPLIIPLDRDTLYKHLSPSLEAFPKNRRKDLLISLSPYLSECASDPEFSDFVMTMGLSHACKTTSTSSPVQVTGKPTAPAAPWITLNTLQQRPYTCSLVEYIAQYLGNESHATSLAMSSQWIQHSAMHVFSDSALFFRELAANAFDAQLPWEKQIGNFGMGFYSIFSMFYQSEQPIERIEITTQYSEAGEAGAYKMIFYKVPTEDLHVRWEAAEKKEAGTCIQILPRNGTEFSPAFLKHLEKTLQDFRFFEHGFIQIDGRDRPIGNPHAPVSIHASLQPSVVSMTDKGCGIPLSKNHLLLVPSISNKRRPVPIEPKLFPLPKLRIVPTKNKSSSLIFTINSVVNSTYDLNKHYVNAADESLDLLIELDKCFKPNLSRDSIILPGRKSPQAKALRHMIRTAIQEVFTPEGKNATLLSMLYRGLEKWDTHGVPAELKGHFLGHFRTLLRKELTRSGRMPCQDHPWLINLKKQHFEDHSKYIPLPEELIPEGYMRFELDLIARFQNICSHLMHHELRQKGLQREIIEGLSVIFLHNSWLQSKDKHTVVTSGPCSSIIFAPVSILEEEPTLEAVQRKICQRYIDLGKHIKPASPNAPSAISPSTIYFPGRAFQHPSAHFISWKAKTLFADYVQKVEHYLSSPFIQSLDKAACCQLFWEYFPKLTSCLTVSSWDHDYDRRETKFTKHQVLFEDIHSDKAFGAEHNHHSDWETWFKQALLVDSPSKIIYKLKNQADVAEISRKMHAIHQTGENYKKGYKVFPELFKHFAPSFESVQEEAFKRLCILMLIQWGIDPYQPKHLFYSENGEHKLLDLALIARGIQNFCFDNKKEHVASQCFFYGGTDIDFSASQEPIELARFTPLLFNIRPLLPPNIEQSLVHFLLDVQVIKQESPSYYTSYWDQLLELYYRYLTIPPEKLPYAYGKSRYLLNVFLENECYHLYQAIHLLRSLPQKIGIKLIQQLMGKLIEKLDLEQRDNDLSKGRLELPSVKGAHILGLLSLFHAASHSHLDLIQHLIEISATYEEMATLAVTVYVSQKEFPEFFTLPIDYQKDSLKIILDSLLRTNDLHEINSLLDGQFYFCTLEHHFKNRLSPTVLAAIDCIKLFASRHQHGSHSLPVFHNNPLQIFQDDKVYVFDYPLFMETLFHHAHLAEILAHNDVKAFLELMENTPMTGKFTDFGMITHASNHGRGYNPRQLPWIELLKNSIQAISTQGIVSLNYGLLPCDAEHSQLTYEVSDNAGFADLQTLLALLVPGYHPRDTQKGATGFFRMLPEVSLIHYRTRLQGDKQQIISFMVQPMRNTNKEIENFKIGLKIEKDDEDFQGTVCRVHMNPQKNIEALMYLKQTHHLTLEITHNIYKDNSKDWTLNVNGHDMWLNSTSKFSIAPINTPFPALFATMASHGYSKQSRLLIDGFPHPCSLKEMLQQAGFEFHELMKGVDVSFPHEFFLPLQDPHKLILKPELTSVAAKFILDWIYLHLFEKEYAERYLEHTHSYHDMAQLVSPPKKYSKTHAQILKGLSKPADYYNFFAQYAYSEEIDVEGVKQRIRLPSFAEYLWQVYQEVYPQWVAERKANKSFLSYSLLSDWCETKQAAYDTCNSPNLIRTHKKLLHTVEEWVKPKIHSTYRNPNPPESKNTDATSTEPTAAITTHFALIKNAKASWVQAKNFIEEALLFYARQVMLLQGIENPQVTLVVKELTPNERGNFQKKINCISIGVNSHPLSDLLWLMLALAKRETGSHYRGDILYSELPHVAGTLNHEILHALKFARGESDEGHKHHHGINFEVCARRIADQARSQGILTALEDKINEMLPKYGWTADTLSQLAKKAQAKEVKMTTH